jgi:hypothetical protein
LIGHNSLKSQTSSTEQKIVFKFFIQRPQEVEQLSLNVSKWDVVVENRSLCMLLDWDTVNEPMTTSTGAGYLHTGESEDSPRVDP